MNLRRAPSVFLVALAVAWSSPARADEFAKREAQARFREGLALHDAGRDEEALPKFVQAYSVLHHANVLFNLARCEQLTKHETDALAHYRLYLRENPEIAASERTTIEGYVRDLSGRVGHVRITAPPNTSIALDGAPVLDWKDAFDVAAGAHALLASYGSQRKSASLTARVGETETVTFEFEGVAPEAKGDTTPRQTVTVNWPPPTPSIILGAVGVVGLGVGVAFAVDASSKSETYNSQPAGVCAIPSSAECHSRQDTLDSLHTSRTLAWVSGATGGVALGAAITWWLVAPRTEERRAQRGSFVPWFGPRAAGAAWTLGF